MLSNHEVPNRTHFAGYLPENKSIIEPLFKMVPKKIDSGKEDEFVSSLYDYLFSGPQEVSMLVKHVL